MTVSVPRAPRTEPRSAEPFAGSDRAGMPVDLLTAEESALRRFSPTRNIWRAIAAFDETAAEFEGQARELMNAMQLEHEALAEARQLDREALADWAANGSKGTSPASEVTRREEQIEDLQRQLEGVEHQVARVLADKAAHVERHRDKLAKDAAKATTAAERRYVELIDELEHARQEVVELRESELWARTYPEVRQGEQEVPPGIAGNFRVLLKKAGIDHALDPGQVFAACGKTPHGFPLPQSRS